MLRITLCLAAAALAGGGRADERRPTPKDPQLLPGTAIVAGENLVCVVTIVRHVPQTRAVTVMKDGKVYTENQTVHVPTYVTEKRLVPLKGVEAYVTGDKGVDPTKRLQPLDPTKLPELLQKNSRVLFPAAGDKVTADQVKDVRDGTVILVLPHPKSETRPPPPPEKK